MDAFESDDADAYRRQARVGAWIYHLILISPAMLQKMHNNRSDQ
jgi:hypothetical protein